MILEARNITRHYDQGNSKLEVLKNLNFALAENETVAVLGQSGSGKSTLLSMLAGLDRPSSGEIFLSGQNITEMSEKALALFRAKQIGIVFQQFHLMTHLTAVENVSLPLEIAGMNFSEAKLKSLKLLEAVGLGARADHFPHQLSGGEKQRVAIARALVIEPPILLADEPSGNLDQKTGESVMNLLFTLVQERGHSLILVTHNETLALQCSRRLNLINGTLVQDAP
jgi:putative ABC transport system ATP-binding protein